ncbi:unnamed protein product [Phyllotreta striolata]|uniref:Gustatory receptor n=1 Tax=Phyllotreta striolata TaxID=444603 RepID=A0A9N9XUB9_PHYSR|nr:unnamed protein product [Phyllotreta striolata]
MSLGNFHKLLRFGFAFSVSPWYDPGKRAFKYRTFNRAYSACLIGFFLASYLFGLVHLECNNKSGFLGGKFASLEIISTSSMATMYLLFRLNRRKTNAWRRLLDNLLLVEEILYSAFGVTLTESFNYLLIPTQLTVVVGYLWYYIYYAENVQTFGKSQGNAFEKFIWLDISRCISLLVCLICGALMKISRMRFVALNEEMKRMQLTGRNRNIKALKVCYGRLLDNIRLYNEIFGSFIFCSIVKTTVEFQGFLTYFIQYEYFSGLHPIRYVYKSGMSSFLSWFCSVYTIFSCDSVAKELAETRRSCFELYLKSLDDWSIDSQQDISDVLELLASDPKFSAGNFFEIRREVVLNMLNVATAYVLVTVQLKGKN